MLVNTPRAVVWIECEFRGFPCETVASEPSVPSLAVPLLRKVLPELGEVYQQVPKHFDDAAWVGSRLVEILPISLGDKQACLEMQDPLQRLARISPLIRRDES